MLLNILRPWLTRQNTCLYDSILLEKMLAIGLYCQAHGNFYVTIASNFNIGKTTIIEAVEDVVDALCDIKQLESNIAFTNQTIIACCVLHNFCIDAGDLWNDDDDGNDEDFPIRDGNADGADLRDFLKEYLWNM